jgi:hypothetical protein
MVTVAVQRSAELTEVLASRGLFAAEMRIQDQSLEQYFLEVTAGGRA